MKSPITSTVLSAYIMPYPPVPVVYEWCKQVRANAPHYSPLSRILHSYAGFSWVTDGARTRALRSHNPMSSVSERCRVLQNRLISADFFAGSYWLFLRVALWVVSKVVSIEISLPVHR